MSPDDYAMSNKPHFLKFVENDFDSRLKDRLSNYDDTKEALNLSKRLQWRFYDETQHATSLSVKLRAWDSLHHEPTRDYLKAELLSGKIKYCVNRSMREIALYVIAQSCADWFIRLVDEKLVIQALYNWGWQGDVLTRGVVWRSEEYPEPWEMYFTEEYKPKGVGQYK